jgi:hypothetical protein
MSLWLGLSIVGVVAAGILMGFVLSNFILRLKRKNSLILHSSLGQDFDIFDKPQDNVHDKPQTNGVSKTHIKPTILLDDKVDTYLSQVNRAPMVRSDTEYKNPSTLAELEKNLDIASGSMHNELIKFQTEVWDTKRSEFNYLTTEVRNELTEAYVDMLLANNIVWLVTELGRDSQDLLASYRSLSDKVAERLQRLIPMVKDALK